MAAVGKELLFAVGLLVLISQGSAWTPERVERSCAALNETCSIFKRCCGSGDCFRPLGFRIFRGSNAMCVECIPTESPCQRNSQCCKGHFCSKSGWWKINGNCEAQLLVGEECRSDSECQGSCKKRWFFYRKGVCSAAPGP